MEWIADPQIWIAFLTLTVLELVLGIDNVIFISILSGRLPENEQPRARYIGLSLALVMRVLLLFSLTWVMGLVTPLFTVLSQEVSGRDLILFIGGLFLIGKSTHEIHGALEGAEGEASRKVYAGFASVIVQIMLLDIVFSLDSVITAVGMVSNIWIMIAAVVVSIVAMMAFAGPIGAFVQRHPTIKVLALAFLLLIGVTLIAEGLHQHISKGYIYFAMAFSVFVEFLNLRLRKKARPVVLHNQFSDEDEAAAIEDLSDPKGSKNMKAPAILIFILCGVVPAFAQKDIHAVDFKNFTYSAHCASDEPEKLIVKNGEYSRETAQDGSVDQVWFRIFSVKYGDLSSDKQDEAIILSVCNTGGTGNFSEGFIYSMKAGKPALVSRIPGGDRAYGGLREAWVENGVLVVERNDLGEMGGACCPEYILTERYDLVGSKIVEKGKAARRPVTSTEPVTFARGTSGKTFKTTIAAGEAKRYTVGARGGQNLSVSVNSDKISLRLIEEAQVTQGVNNFLANLPKNGVYTIELENTSNVDIEVTINIKIN